MSYVYVGMVVVAHHKASANTGSGNICDRHTIGTYYYVVHVTRTLELIIYN